MTRPGGSIAARRRNTGDVDVNGEDMRMAIMGPGAFARQAHFENFPALIA
jgi:hypothetical protein